MKSIQSNSGFTLIELVMVIVILGILAAFALPRFADLGSEARTATLDGARGSVKSAAAIAHSKWLASDQSSTIVMEGNTSVAMSSNGYPTAAAGIEAAAQLTDFDVTASSGVATVTAQGATDSDSDGTIECYFQYDESDGSVSTPTDAESEC